MHFLKTPTNLFKNLALVTLLSLAGCSDQNNSTSTKDLPWWDELTEDTVLAVKTSPVPAELLQKLPTEVADFSAQYLGSGATLRIRVKEGDTSAISDYLEVGALIDNGVSLELVEDSKLLSAYKSSHAPTSWEIRLIFSSTDSEELMSRLQKNVEIQRGNIRKNIAQELERRGIKPQEAPATKVGLLIATEYGKKFMQLGSVPPVSSPKPPKLIWSSYEQSIPEKSSSNGEWSTVLYVSTPEMEKPTVPKIPSWTPGHRAANEAVSKAMEEWQKLAGSTKFTSLTELKVSTSKASARTLVDTSESPWLDLKSVKNGLSWVPWSDAIVQGAFVSLVGKTSPVTSEFSDLFARQLALITIPSVLESSVLMTEAEADENVRKNIASATEKIKSVVEEIGKTTARQIGFAFWSSAEHSENIALWADCDRAENILPVAAKISDMTAEWFGIDLSEGIAPVQLSSPSSSGWALSSPVPSGETDLYMGIDTSTQKASFATSKSALERALAEPTSPASSLSGILFKLSVDTRKAASKLVGIPGSASSADIQQIQETLGWVGSVEVTAKIADKETVEITIETSGK